MTGMATGTTRQVFDHGVYHAIACFGICDDFS